MNLMELMIALPNQFKVFHWQTKSHAEHGAFGDVYGSLEALADNFMEVYMGKYERPSFSGKLSIELSQYSESQEKIINAYIKVLSEDMPGSLKENDTDLLNIRDEMLAELNKLKYLLTLK